MDQLGPPRVAPQMEETMPAKPTEPTIEKYAFAIVHNLPKVNPTRCWISIFVNERKQAQLVGFLVRAHPFAIFFFLLNVYITSASNIYGNRDFRTWTNAILFIATVMEVCCWWLPFSIDITKLIMRTYEFWYLTIINCIAQVLYIYLTRDARALFFLMACLGYQGVFFSDANVYSRRQELLLLLLVSPACVFLVALTQARFLSDIRHVSFHLGDAILEDSDVALGTLVLIIQFILVKVARSKDLILSKKHALRIHTLSIYRAAVFLQPTLNERQKDRMNHCESLGEAMQLRMRPFPTPIIDSAKILVPGLHPTAFTDRHRLLIRCLGYAALVFTITVLQMTATASNILSDIFYKRLLISITYVTTAMFVALYLACSQYDLLKMILTSGDAFVSLAQLHVIALCAFDAIGFDIRFFLITTVVLWGNISVVIEAVTPNTRRHLGYQQWFMTLVVWFNSYSIFILIVWFFIKKKANKVYDHTLISWKYSADMPAFEIRVLTILGSQLIGALFWSLRSTYRESVRPTNVFKVLEGTVTCRLPRNVYNGVFQEPVGAAAPSSVTRSSIQDSRCSSAGIPVAPAVS